jgi:multidrug efflux pump subunit AcrB
LAAHYPEGRVTHTITDDTTEFVLASLNEVGKTLLEAGLLVLIVVYVFLQSWRATIIPMVAVPVSLIGTMVGLWLFDFSLNTMTLFAMTLAIGIVVDDAIVVLENVERIMVSENVSPKVAAKRAMKEVAGALVAIVLVLSAVFVPVAFLGGMAGANSIVNSP